MREIVRQEADSATGEWRMAVGLLGAAALATTIVSVAYSKGFEIPALSSAEQLTQPTQTREPVYQMGEWYPLIENGQLAEPAPAIPHAPALTGGNQMGGHAIMES